jgi:hypothetical protein
MRPLSLLCLLLLAAVLPAASPADNLANNPGFEEWPPRPEGGEVWAATSYSIGVPGRDGGPAGRAFRTGEGELDTQRRSGQYAQYLQTTTWGQGAIARGVPVTVGHRYRVSVWVKVLKGKFQLGVCFAHAPWTYLGDWAYSDPRTEWVQITKEVVIPAGCHNIATVMFLQSGVAYLDDLEIVDLGPATEVSPEADTLPLLPGRLAAEITRRRVALFAVPDFPSDSPRDVPWYEATLRAAGLQVTRIGWPDLSDPRQLSRERFDTLILPTGGNFPTAAEAAVEQFLARGGTVLIDESLVLRTATPPADDVRQKIKRLHQDYLDGKGGYAYFDFLSRHLWVPYGNMFDWDEAEKRWRTTLNRTQNYEYLNPAYYPEGLGLRPWPNTAQSVYARAYAEPLHRNETLAVMLSGFPETLPAEANPSRDRGAIRLQQPGDRVGVAPEYACDLLLPLYKFAQPSGQAYPAYPEAGKEERDRESDFYLLRYHNARLEGGTLLHFGTAGARLLGGAEGATVLREALRLAESELPGECPPEFVQAAHRGRDLFSRYSGQSLQYREALVKLAQMAVYSGRGATVSELRERLHSEAATCQQLSARFDQLERLLLKRDGHRAYGHQGRLALATALEGELTRLAPLLAEARQALPPPPRPLAGGQVKSPFGRLYFGLDNTDTRGAPGLQEFRQQIEQLGLRYEGYHLTSYRQEYTFNGHPFKREFDSGILDPLTGVVKPHRFRWPETPEDQAHWQESFRWQLERVNRDPQTTSIYGMDERDFEWSLWGPRDRLLFLEYLQGKYQQIARLNATWNTSHADFDAIQLPVSRPLTQSEHACWEDWTRFREVYRLEREMKLSTEAVLRYAPNRRWRYLTWSTYNQHGRQPANGINFYEYGKHLPVNGFEHSNEDAKEWLAFDICSMFSKHCTAEWGTLYFPPATHPEKVDLLTERLWKGLVNGQVGWSLYTFSNPRWAASNYLDLMNHPLPLGWKLSQIKQQADVFEPLLLDGQRGAAPIRIVYSPTTRRHTSWPGIEEDLSFRATGGLYTLLRNSHLHARALDEQALWEGHLPPDCRLLILPQVRYENQALQAKVRSYLQAGGHVLVTPDSGQWDEYGRRRDSWLTLAGVVPQRVSEKVIPLGEGLRYFSAAHPNRLVGLAPVFPDEVQVLARFAGGEPALTQTTVGKGKLFVVGCALGLDCHDQWQGNPAVVRALLAPVLSAAGITQEVALSRQDIMVRPWQYQGRRYLLLACLGRDGLSEYELTLEGAWQVRDVLLNQPLKATRTAGQTRATGVIASPGGLVLELTAAPGRATATVPPPRSAAPPAPPPATPAAAVPLDEQTPFEGRLWARDGTLRLGDFTLELDVETGGGWGGTCYLTARLGKERRRQRCVAGQDTVFYFTDRTLRVACREVTSVYPSNLLARVTVEPPQVEVGDCRLLRETYHGQDSLVLTNGLLRARLLPKLGGRLIELTTLPDETNHLYANPELIKQGIGTAWSDFGGLEENAGGFPGPYWNAPFTASILEETPQRLVVRLAMTEPVAWAYGYARPTSGRNRLVKEFTLRRGESRLQVDLQGFNDSATTAPVGLRTHPVWQIGGDSDPADRWIFTTNSQLMTRTYPFPGDYPAEGDWTALVDTAKRTALLQGFSPEVVATLYTHVGARAYGLELWARVREVPAGQALALSHSLSLIQGLGGVEACRDGVALQVDTGGTTALGQGETLNLEVEVGSVSAQTATLTTMIRQNGKTLASLGTVPVTLLPGRAVTHRFTWTPGPLPDGDYDLVAALTPPDGPALEARRVVALSRIGRQQRLEGLAGYDRQLQVLQQAYLSGRQQKVAPAELAARRARAVQAALLLAELRTLIAAGQTAESQAVEQQLQELLPPPAQ